MPRVQAIGADLEEISSKSSPMLDDGLGQSNGLCRESGPPRTLSRRREPATGHSLARPLSTLGTIGIVAVSRRDSDLEAFSHNPTDGSFAPLIGRSST